MKPFPGYKLKILAFLHCRADRYRGYQGDDTATIVMKAHKAGNQVRV